MWYQNIQQRKCFAIVIRCFRILVGFSVPKTEKRDAGKRRVLKFLKFQPGRMMRKISMEPSVLGPRGPLYQIFGEVSQ
jgi:hypothetical protein